MKLFLKWQTEDLKKESEHNFKYAEEIWVGDSLYVITVSQSLIHVMTQFEIQEFVSYTVHAPMMNNLAITLKYKKLIEQCRMKKSREESNKKKFSYKWTDYNAYDFDSCYFKDIHRRNVEQLYFELTLVLEIRMKHLQKW